MKINFSIRYHTAAGETIYIEWRNPRAAKVALGSHDGELWSAEVDCPSAPMIEYSYALYNAVGESVRCEIFTLPHTLIIDHAQATRSVVVEDSWCDLPREAYRYSAAFSAENLCNQQVDPLVSDEPMVTLRAIAPALSSQNQRLSVVGSSSELGCWGEGSAIAMREEHTNLWCVTLPQAIFAAGAEYKFVAIDPETNKIAQWEEGANRSLTLAQSAANYFPPHAEVLFARPAVRVAGSAIPIFSLRSEGGCGVGDFGDLKEYIRWAAKTDQRVVQILPINDTTISNSWQDSYPYNSISIYAFNPIYIDLRELPALKSDSEMASFEKQRAELNALPQMDYEIVCRLKQSYLRSIFEQVGAQTLRSEEFREFFAANNEWLVPYAAFSVLRDRFSTANFSEWGEYSCYDSEAIERLCCEQSAAYHLVSYYYYLQYLLHVQLLAAATLARSLGVILKGDIPIGISRESVEAWVEPHYFNMNGQAGAPPDPFSANGQNWGFPTYNWAVMQRDNYRWWRGRFAKMADYFSAYRIDHILGFFRIWEIPQHSVHGLLGHFSPALPMSVDEIEGWGLSFEREPMTTPQINDQIIDSLFGDSADLVREKFLLPLGEGRYAMRPEFDEQRKVERYFALGELTTAAIAMREALYVLISNVLFIEDEQQSNHFHPRITVQDAPIFGSLTEQQQQAFNALYDHYYYRRHNDFWYAEAMKKLPVLIGATPMLVCGEDLGMVPECVPPVMHALQIISLEIERMPKQLGAEFGSVASYPHSSVCTIGTHDMSTLRGWWREDRALTQRYFNTELQQQGAAPAEATAEICRSVVSNHLNSSSMLAILTWQDWLSIDADLRNQDIESERINIPANPRHYWRWRMHLTLEQLHAATELNRSISELIASSGRKDPSPNGEACGATNKHVDC